MNPLHHGYVGNGKGSLKALSIQENPIPMIAIINNQIMHAPCIKS